MSRNATARKPATAVLGYGFSLYIKSPMNNQPFRVQNGPRIRVPTVKSHSPACASLHSPALEGAHTGGLGPFQNPITLLWGNSARPAILLH